jgi:hypothetical protein
VWLNNSIKKNNGAPIVVKNRMVVTWAWVNGRTETKGAIA